MYKTGIPACDALNELHIQGNIIPRIWFKTIVKGDLKHPKPHLLAINILSDIVYWYRPKEIRDEISGELKGYSKKFRSDLLQRSYDDLAETYSCSNDTVKEAVVFLEKKIGVISRVFRDVTVGGIRCNNIMFLDLNVDRLRELTYPTGEIPTEGAGKSSRRVEETSPETAGESPRTNTENIVTNISSDISQSIYPVAPGQKTYDNGIDRIDLHRHKTMVDGIIKDNIEYDILCLDYDQERVDELSGLIVDTICTVQKTIRIGRQDLSISDVERRFLSLSRYHIAYVFDCLDKNTTKVYNIKSYLLTALYNAPLTMNLYYSSAVNHDVYSANV